MRRIRGSSLLLALIGGLILLRGLTSSAFFGYNPPLIIGSSILCYDLVTLFRHRGDYDDFDEPEVKEDGDVQEESGDVE